LSRKCRNKRGVFSLKKNTPLTTAVYTDP